MDMNQSSAPGGSGQAPHREHRSKPTTVRKSYKCSVCGVYGHYRLTCPNRQDDEDEDKVFGGAAPGSLDPAELIDGSSATAARMPTRTLQDFLRMDPESLRYDTNIASAELGLPKGLEDSLAAIPLASAIEVARRAVLFAESNISLSRTQDELSVRIEMLEQAVNTFERAVNCSNKFGALSHVVQEKEEDASRASKRRRLEEGDDHGDL